MAKADTVYSMFGMKSPEQIARERVQEQQRYIMSQQDPYQKAGAAIGVGLSRLFGGPSAEEQKAQQFQDIVASARGEMAQDKQARKAAEQAALDEQLSGFEGALLSEYTPDGQLPQIPERTLTQEEKMLGHLNQRMDYFTKLADKLGNMPGFEAQALAAENKATEAGMQVFSMQKMIAEAKKAAMPKAPTIKEFKEGDKIITKEWNGQQWVKVGEADRYKPMSPAELAAAMTAGQKGLRKSIGEGLGKTYTEYSTQIDNAYETFANLDRMERLLDEGIRTGSLAKSQTAIDAFLNKMGLIDGRTVTNTQTYMMLAARETVNLLQTGAVGSGTAISDGDREFLGNVANGNINLTEDSLQRLISISRQVAQGSFKKYNNLIDRMIKFDKDISGNVPRRYFPGQKLKWPSGDVYTFDPDRGFLDANGNPPPTGAQ